MIGEFDGRVVADLAFAEGETPRLLVFNKTDLLDNEQAAALRYQFDAVTISAKNRRTFAPLLRRMEHHLWGAC